MDKDRIEGGARETVGIVKDGAGRLMGDAKTRAEGLYDQAAGAAQRTYGQAKDAASEGAAVVAQRVEQNPLSSMLTVGAIGFILGWLARGRN